MTKIAVETLSQFRDMVKIMIETPSQFRDTTKIVVETLSQFRDRVKIVIEVMSQFRDMTKTMVEASSRFLARAKNAGLCRYLVGGNGKSQKKVIAITGFSLTAALQQSFRMNSDDLSSE